MNCDRCGQATNVTTMSFFNTEVICTACSIRERAHPLYDRARQAEETAVMSGDYNFPGIGLPLDLRRRSQ